MIPWVTANTKKARSNVLTTIKLKFQMIKQGYFSFYHMKSTAKLCSNQNYRISSNKRWNSNKLCTVSHSDKKAALPNNRHTSN